MPVLVNGRAPSMALICLQHLERRLEHEIAHYTTVRARYPEGVRDGVTEHMRQHYGWLVEHLQDLLRDVAGDVRMATESEAREEA